jgi:hypothetical protein
MTDRPSASEIDGLTQRGEAVGIVGIGDDLGGRDIDAVVERQFD